MKLKILATALCLMLAACGKTDTPATPSAAGNVSKIGLIVSGNTSDHGWDQLAWDSLQFYARAHDRDVEVSKMESVERTAAADAIRQFDSKDCGIIIAHGFEFQVAAIELSKAGTLKAKLVLSGGDADNSGFQSLAYDLTGASYQLGVVAARVSKTGKLGFIAGEEIPSVTSMKRGFEAGAKSVNPNATVSAQYTGWTDSNKAKQQAQAFFQQGIDVVMQNVDAASKGVFEAVQEYNAVDAKRTPGAPAVVYTFGANADQNANGVCDQYTLASAVIKMDLAFSHVIDQVKDGTFKGGIVKEDLASGVSVAVLNPKLVGNIIDAETQKLVDDAGKKLISGAVKVPEQ